MSSMVGFPVMLVYQRITMCTTQRTPPKRNKRTTLEVDIRYALKKGKFRFISKKSVATSILQENKLALGTLNHNSRTN